MYIICLIAALALGGGPTPAHSSPNTGKFAPLVQILDQGWRYHPGDNPAWADPDWDDSSWTQRKPFLEDGPWPGLGWFRLHLHFDAAQSDSLALLFHQLGAAEIYIDGIKTHTLGQVGSNRQNEVALHHHELTPLPIKFQPGPDHLIAVRYSNFAADQQRRLGLTPGFIPYLAPFDGQNPQYLVRKHARLQMFFTGTTLAFGVLHLLLFAFYPPFRENLYYALHTLTIAMLTYTVFESQITSIENLLLFNRFNRLPMILTSITGLLFLYSLFHKQPPRQFWFFLATGLGVWAATFNTSINYTYIFILVSLIEWLRVVLLALYRRQSGATIVGVGILIFVAAIAYQMLMLLRIVGYVGPLSYVYLVGVLGMLVAMSIHLARRFGRAHLALEAQLDQVRALSANLEEKVEQRTAELTQKNSELEAAYDQLQQTQSQLAMQEKMASLGNLVAGVSHEINTPVGAIKSAADVSARCVRRLVEGLEDTLRQKPRLQKALTLLKDNTQLILTASERVAEIVLGLKTFARLDEAQLQEAHIHEGLETTLALVGHQTKNRIEIIREYGDVPPIHCYPGELNQVFMNLLVNAAQAIEDRGQITIRTRTQGDWVQIQITDSGQGIPDHLHQRIFDPGFTTKGVKVGTGLGLSISYKIVEKHQGQIQLESQLGQGTTFTVTLPVRPADPAQA